MVISKLYLILNKLDNSNHFSQTELQHITYSITAIWNDLSKFILFTLFFLYTNNFISYFFIFISTTILRFFTGGMHFRTYFQCLFISSIYYYLLIFIISYDLNTYMYTFCIAMSILSILVSPQLPSNSQRVINISRNKIQCIALIFHYLLFLCYLFNPIFFKAIPYIIIIHAFQLITMKGAKFMKAYKEKKILYKSLTILLALAPILATKQASAIFWGESKIPETLLAKKSPN